MGMKKGLLSLTRNYIPGSLEDGLRRSRNAGKGGGERE